MRLIVRHVRDIDASEREVLEHVIGRQLQVKVDLTTSAIQSRLSHKSILTSRGAMAHD